jgi:hypothetical protein
VHAVAVVDDIALRGSRKTAGKNPMPLGSQLVVEGVNGGHLLRRGGFGERVDDEDHEVFGHGCVFGWGTDRLESALLPKANTSSCERHLPQQWRQGGIAFELDARVPQVNGLLHIEPTLRGAAYRTG